MLWKTCSKSQASPKVRFPANFLLSYSAGGFLITVLFGGVSEVERQLQGGISSSPHLSSKKAANQSQNRLTSNVVASRTGTAPVQLRRATNTKGKPVPAPPKRTR